MCPQKPNKESRDGSDDDEFLGMDPESFGQTADDLLGDLGSGIPENAAGMEPDDDDDEEDA